MSANKPRLGRGLSGLLSKPVEVTQKDVSTTIVYTSIQQAGGSGDGGLRLIAVGAVMPNRYQPRGSIDEAALRELSESIRRSGVMQPIAVRRATGQGVDPGIEFELVAGERRWRAARMAGLAQVPALVVSLDDRGAAEWAIVENVQREDLNPIDRALAFERLIAEFGATQSEVAERIGVNRVTVANTLRLLDLEPPIADLVATGALSAGHAKALLMAPAGDARIAAGKKAAAAGWSVRALEQWASEAARAARAARGDTDPSRESAARVSPHTAAMEKQLGDHLGTRVRVKTNASGKKGEIVVEFYSLEHFEGVIERMGFRMES